MKKRSLALCCLGAISIIKGHSPTDITKAASKESVQNSSTGIDTDLSDTEVLQAVLPHILTMVKNIFTIAINKDTFANSFPLICQMIASFFTMGSHMMRTPLETTEASVLAEKQRIVNLLNWYQSMLSITAGQGEIT